MSTSNTDEALEGLHLRLHDAGILRDGRKHTEPFATFLGAYNDLQSAYCNKADAQTLNEYRKLAQAAAPAAEAALFRPPIDEVEPEPTLDVGEPRSTEIAPPDDAAEEEQEVIEPHLLDDALEATESQRSPEVVAGLPPGHRSPKVVAVADLRANPINATVFTSSLQQESIRKLADDIAVNGLRNAIEVNEDHVVLEGERRLRALTVLGVRETEVVVVSGKQSVEDIEGYILDAFSANRDADVLERANLFRLGLTVLTRRHGRPRGRPAKDCRVDNLFWTTEAIRKEAAKRAGFGSYETAQRAVRVLREADDDTQRKLMGGDLTVNAAYEALRMSNEPSIEDAAPTVVAAPLDDDPAAPEEHEEAPSEGDAVGHDNETEKESLDEPMPQAEQEAEDEETQPPESSQNPTPTDPLMIVLSDLHARGSGGPRHARLVIEKVATQMGIEVYVPSDDPSDNLEQLQEVVGQELLAVHPAEAREWLDDLRSLLPELED